MSYEYILEEILRLKKGIQLLYDPIQWAMLDKIGVEIDVQNGN